MSAPDDAGGAGGDAEEWAGIRASSMSELMSTLRPIMRAIAAAAGPHCEVVLHDLTGQDPERTIIAIEHGHVTGRGIGGSSTNLGLAALQDGGQDHDAFGYASRAPDGRELRASSVYFRNHAGQVIGSLCINVDLTPSQRAVAAIQQMTPPAPAPAPAETLTDDITEVLEDLIEAAIARTGRTVGLMDRADKVDVIDYLDVKGAFFVKRAMQRVAERLGLSRVTAYSYLDRARSRRE